MNERIQRAAHELLPAIGYGDAAGVPFETKSAHEIAERGGVTELMASYDNPFFKGIWDPGTTSDDTQLSVAVAESLIEAGGFSLDALRDRHIAAYYETERTQRTDGRTIVRGWGGSTTRALERLIQGVPPEESGQPEGNGNGVVMKMAPLAIWQALHGVDVAMRHEQYDKLTTMTHDSDVARLCTRVHGEVLDALLHGGRTLRDSVHESVQPANGVFPDEAALLLRAVDAPCQDFDQLVERYAAGKSGKKYGFYVPETLAIVYDIMLGSGGDFDQAVYWAVNLGGDCDSTASIVASMIACSSRGEYEKPQDIHKVQNISRLYEVSRKLGDIAL